MKPFETAPTRSKRTQSRRRIAYSVLAAIAVSALFTTALASAASKRPTAESCLADPVAVDLVLCHRLAVELASRHEYERAIAIESPIQALLPADPEIASALARMHHLGTGNIILAIKLYHAALGNSSGYPPALLGLGTIMQEKGHLEVAEAYFERGAREHPSIPQFPMRLAEVMVRLGRVEQAQPVLEEIVQRWPDSGEAESARRMLTRTDLARP